jgi:hypothetical protein
VTTKESRAARGTFAWQSKTTVSVEHRSTNGKMGARWPLLPTQIHRSVMSMSGPAVARGDAPCVQEGKVVGRASAMTELSHGVVVMRPSSRNTSGDRPPFGKLSNA